MFSSFSFLFPPGASLCEGEQIKQEERFRCKGAPLQSMRSA